MSKYNLGDYITLLLPITYYLNIDVRTQIILDNVVYVRSIFQIKGLTLLEDMGTGYHIKDVRYGIELDVTEHFIKKYFVTRMYGGL